MARARFALSLVCAALLPCAAVAQNAAQDDDRSYLTALLEDNLSGAGRQVVITGFEGALSSQARLQSLTIADAEGVWITLKDVALDWRRSDLLAGEITISSLTAGEITLTRLPQAEGGEITAEAPAFALPELPVAIRIGTIAVEKLHLAAAVLGQEVNASASASMQLAGGEGRGSLTLQRNDSDLAQGRAQLEISFANATRQLKIDLAASETSGGILAQALGVPGAPALELAVAGDAPLSDFSADLTLRSDGISRLGGSVAWASRPRVEGGEATDFKVDLAGDLSVLVKPDFRPFFGTQTTLRARGQTRADGGFDMPEFALTSAAMDVAGQLSLAASGQPDAFSLSARLASPTGGALTLPLALDRPATIANAQISADFDASKGETFKVVASLQDWAQEGLRISNAQFSADGRITQGGTGAQVSADLAFTGEGVRPSDGAVARALGSVVWGDGALVWQQGGALILTGLRLMGEDYAARIDGTLGDIANGVIFRGSLGLSAQDFSRFSGVLGQPIAGAGEVDYQGQIALLSRAFDGELRAQTTDLAFGIAAVDASLQGAVQLSVSARRDETGLDLRDLTLAARGLSAQLSGKVSATGSALVGRFAMLDLPAGERGFGGAMAGEIALTGPLKDARVTISAQSDGLSMDNPAVQKLAGQGAQIAAELVLQDFAPQLVMARLSSPLVRVQLGQDGVGGPYRVTADLTNLAVIFPELSGAVTLSGTATPMGDGAALDVDLTGPANLKARINGQASAGQSNDLRLTGRADGGIVNAFIAPRTMSGDAQFDLRLRGLPDMTGLTGDIRLSDGRLADPSLPFTLRELTLGVQLAGGRAIIDGRANSSAGGGISVKGGVGLPSPHQTEVTIGLRNLGLRDPALYQTVVAGNLNLTGPLLGGAKLAGKLDLGRTEVQLTVPNLIEGAPLPNLQHKGDAAAVQRTRARAGFDQHGAGQTDAAAIGLDITLRAANRLFVRGRGLDAELGGEVRLQGDSGNVQPNGSFDLVQGHFDILTTRLDLEAVRLELRGEFIPFLSVRAINVKGSTITTAIIDGPALDPDFSFASAPERPEEEVLSQLLFDQSLQNLTVLQAVQLTSAVASLTGRGEGIVARLRKTLRLDNLDVQSDDEGNSALKLGKYVSENVYSELSSEGTGKQSLDFTYTLNEKIKLRAGADTTGNTSLGIELETNY